MHVVSDKKLIYFFCHIHTVTVMNPPGMPTPHNQGYTRMEEPNTQYVNPMNIK